MVDFKFTLLKIDYFLAIYFIMANLTYLIALIASTRRIAIRKKHDLKREQKLDFLSHGKNTPKVSIIVPAYNESKVIYSNIMSLLDITYKNIEIIIINDGSDDQTFSIIDNYFQLKKIFPKIKRPISQAEIIDYYQSKTYPQLKLINQKNAGKAIALNSGIDLSRGELVCTVDADTLVDKDAILLLVDKYLEDPVNTYGVGGTIRILNGAKWSALEKKVLGKIPNSLIVRLQIVEYIRIFFGARIGWDHMNGTLFMSGALSMFKRSSLKEVKGFDAKSITEDFEIVLRMRHHFGEKGKKIQFKMIPVPICWTQVPDNVSQLKRQRVRWHQGLCETMKNHFQMIFNQKYGQVAFTSIPYIIFYEWLGPIIEFIAYIAVGLSLYLNIIDHRVFYSLIGIGISYSAFLTLFSIHLEEKYYARHHSKSDIMIYLFTTIIENVGYRQLNWWWRFSAMCTMPFQKKKWVNNERREVDFYQKDAA